MDKVLPRAISARRRVVLAVVGVLAMLTATAATAAVTGFKDVPDDHLFATEIEWLAGHDITRGCNPPANDMFCPDGYVTRGQMAAFLYRFANNVPMEGPQGLKGEKGDPGQDGADGRDGVTGYSVGGGEIPIAPGNFSVTKACKDGKVAIGGGFRIFPHGADNREDVTVTVSSPGGLIDTPNGWVATAWEVEGHHAGSQSATLDVQVICADIAG